MGRGCRARSSIVTAETGCGIVAGFTRGIVRDIHRIVSRQIGGLAGLGLSLDRSIFGWFTDILADWQIVAGRLHGHVRGVFFA
jgi:hypothetical protein